MNQITTIDNATGQVETTGNFRADLMKMEGQISSALPKHIPVDRFMRVVLTAVNMNPDLVKADQRSLLGSAMKAAQDGLLPDGRDGAFVVFNSKDKEATKRTGRDVWVAMVQWMPMIGGILKKVRNSGDLLSISAYVVYEKDKFYYRLGDDEKIEHEPCIDGPAGEPKLVYAIARTKDGGIYREVMTLAQVQKVRNVSKAKDSGPWVQWWDEMAKKTVLKRLAKRLPTSADLDDLLRRDDDLYDFKGARDKDDIPSTFVPVANPLKDTPALEDKTPKEDPKPEPNRVAANPHDRFNGDAKDFASADFVISRSGKILKDRGETPSFIIDQRFDRGDNGKDDLFASYDEWIGVCTANKMATELGQEWKQQDDQSNEDDAVRSQGGEPDGDERPAEPAGEASGTAAPQQRASENNAPSKPAASRGPAQPPKGLTFDGPEGYLNHMRDTFDRATSKTAINEAWNGTREDRKELLGLDEIDALTKERDEALKKFAKS